ncbi:MAG: hypothetical protein CBC48_15560 [bacterium TMED88]|nr:MAG: hypothetical protein CBC48_15560 [bacterium TMED88]
MSTEKLVDKSLDDDYFIRNAIYCFLHYFPDHKWAPIYKELMKRETFNNVEPNDTKAPSRPQRRKTTIISKDTKAK